MILASLSVEELVALFADICVKQWHALEKFDTSAYRRLFGQMMAVENELKAHKRDRRVALTALFDHPNIQVRLAAAKATLAVAPQESRDVIAAVAALNWNPQSGDAGMCLALLDEGTFKPT